MKKLFCVLLPILLVVSVVAAGCSNDDSSVNFEYDDNVYTFTNAYERKVTIYSGKFSTGETLVGISGYYFGYSDITLSAFVYSSPSFPLGFEIGGSNLTATQLATRAKIVDLFTKISNMADLVDRLATTTYDGSDDIPPSEVYLYNVAETGTRLEISFETYEMLKLAQEMYLATGKAFNPAVYRLVDLWGFSSRLYQQGRFGEQTYDRQVGTGGNYNGYPLPDEKYIDAFSDPSFTDFSENAVTLEESNGKYYVTKNVAAAVVDGEEFQQWIDLGGIAKGYVVDRAKQMMKSLGIDRYDVDAGGSSISLGLDYQGNHTRLAMVDVFDPLATLLPDYADTALTVDVGATDVSTSGQYIRKYSVDGVEYSHIIDGAKGAPAQTGVKSVTVVVPDDVGEFWATKGDCLTTALTVMGYDGIVEFVGGYLKDNGIKVVVQYESLTGNRQLLSTFSKDEMLELSKNYRNFQWNDNGFYVANHRLNSRLDNYTWILIVLGSVFGAGAIALIVYHFVRGKSRTVTNVQSAKRDKPFKVVDLLVYMFVALVIIVLFYTMVLNVDKQPVQIVNVIDMNTNETLFTYNISTGDGVANPIGGWQVVVGDKTDGKITVTFTRMFGDEERVNKMEITLGQTPSVKMIDSVCGFSQDCVRNFPLLDRAGGAIVCSPNRLKVITQ